MARPLLVAALLLSGTCAGCKDEAKNKSPEPAASVKFDRAAALDPGLGAALAGSASAAPAYASEDGPPTAGIFEVGTADATHKKGAKADIKLGTDGKEPRVLLAPKSMEVNGTVALSVGTRTGPRSGLPTVEMLVDLSTKKAAEGEKDAPAGPWNVVAKVRASKLSKRQLGQVPPAAAAEIGKLKGSEMRLVLDPDVGPTDLSISLSKNAIPELERVMGGAAEALFASIVPFPKKPVGIGAIWIARTRHAFSGIDVISFRMYRVKSIEPDQVTLAVEVRQYAADPKIAFAGMPPDITLQQFDSMGQGEVKLRRGQALANEATLGQRLGLGFPDPKGQMVSMQITNETNLMRAAKRPPPASP